MIRAAVLAVLLVPAAVIGLDTPLVMADSHLPEGAFVTTWRVTDTDKTIKIPVGGQTGNYTVDWGDGTDSTTHVSDATHTYSTAGDYTVSISGDFKKIFLNGVRSSSVSEAKNAKHLLSIEQWGDMEWSSMASAFRGASSMMYNAVDTPDLSNVKSMEYMFNAARAFNGDLSSWNVSQVTNMGFMYHNADAFNGDISGWNVSKVTNMRAMFASADAFNQPLNRWDVSQVTNMDSMFIGADAFNGDISSWNVSAVTDMNSMFNGASSFNGDISSWNVSAVTDMNSMFNGASSFNGDISSWNVSAVTDMSSMFDGASSFNGDISIWNVSAVTDMNGMFSGASSFNGDISTWNVSAVTGMNSMFIDASFNGDISRWNVSAVTDMNSMFNGASFNGDISSWNVSAVTYMTAMFSGASFNGDISIWNVSAVTDMSYMFSGASSFNGDISSWNVSAVTNMNSMFNRASSFEQNLGEWYIMLDNASVTGILQTVGNITTQNEFLATQGPTYGIGSSSDSEHFGINGTALVLTTIPDANPAIVNITSTGDFGTSNSRIFEITFSSGVVDTTNPRLESIERYSPVSQNTNSQSLIYEVTFSESVTGVTSSDFILSPDSTGGGTTTFAEQFTQTRSPNLTIPDLQTVSDTITVSDSGTVASVSVAVNITHTYIGDLKIDLIAPDGTTRTLHNRSGGSADDIDQTYAPSFGSIPISGAWKLQINDNYNADPGTLNSWTLTINYGDTTTTVNPVTGVSGSGDTYYVTVSSSTDGTYNLDLIENSGIKDNADNPLTNTVATGTDQTYTVIAN